MRILFVNNYLGYFGGVEQNIASTAEGLTKRGHECHLAWGRRARSPENYGDLFASATMSVEAGGAAGPSVAEIALRVGADVIYFHKVSRLPDGLSAMKHVRLVRMVHDHDLCCPRRHKYYVHNQRICTSPNGWRCWLDGGFIARESEAKLGFRLQSLFAHKAEMKRNWSLDHLLVGSRFMREELLMNGCSADRTSILPPSVPAPAEFVQLENAGSTIPTVLFVGQLIRGKGVDLMLSAFKQIRVPFQAIIVGDGNARGALEDQCRELGLSGLVRFAGWTANSEMAGYYAAATLAVVPSRWPEPFGMTGLEAMGHGRPVIAFRAGGIPDWLNDGVTGFMADEQDTAALARLIEKLLENPAMARSMGEAGRQRLIREFNFENYLVRLETLLTSARLRAPQLEASL